MWLSLFSAIITSDSIVHCFPQFPLFIVFCFPLFFAVSNLGDSHLSVSPVGIYFFSCLRPLDHRPSGSHDLTFVKSPFGSRLRSRAGVPSGKFAPFGPRKNLSLVCCLSYDGVSALGTGMPPRIWHYQATAHTRNWTAVSEVFYFYNYTWHPLMRHPVIK